MAGYKKFGVGVAAFGAATFSSLAAGVSDPAVAQAILDWMATAGLIAAAGIGITVTWMGIRMLRRIK